MDRLRALRMEKHLSQREMAEMLRITQVAYGYYESNKRKIPMDTLKFLANFFRVSADYILGITDFRPYPVIGRIACGKGCLAEYDEIDQQIFPYAAKSGETLYVVELVGDSMRPHFFDGDRVLIREDKTIVAQHKVHAVQIGNEATLKIVDLQEDGILLSAFNTAVYQPHFYSKKQCIEESIRILGVPVSLLRRSIEL